MLSAFLVTNLVAQTVNIYPASNQTSGAPPNPPAATTPTTANPALTAEAAAATAPTDSPTAPDAVPGETEYTVVSGDSLWKIAHHHKVTVESIKTLNQLPNDKLKIGLVLRIPPPLVPKTKKSTQVKTAGPEVRKALGLDGKPLATTVMTPPPPPPPPTLQEQFTFEIKQIASNKIAYNHAWIPPGEQESWVMDCSNTTRWLYKKVQKLAIPRTASDQYDGLYKENKVWKAPRNPADNSVDVDYLSQHLQTGDLLFWENTYKPDRQPPITHVALYLGKDDQGRMLMAASSSSPGLFNAAGSGPDVYLFDPNAPSGGYTTGFFGWNHVKGEFVGYGRPLNLNGTPTAVPPASTAKTPTVIKAPN